MRVVSVPPPGAVISCGCSSSACLNLSRIFARSEALDAAKASHFPCIAAVVEALLMQTDARFALASAGRSTSVSTFPSVKVRCARAWSTSEKATAPRVCLSLKLKMSFASLRSLLGKMPVRSPLMPRGGGISSMSLGRSSSRMKFSAYGSKRAHTSLNTSTSSRDASDGLRSPTLEKVSMMTATTRLRKTKPPITWKEMKYGTATAEPQLPSALLQPPGAAATMASLISPDQPSPVRHWKSSKPVLPRVSKLTLSVR
mmetsp:Transcript_11060/g.25485  ORF Transcript_11060/g.25485 Transcript_11060/m.25485 type:complete len:257 (-) Transcript_11060:205-975(-)